MAKRSKSSINPALLLIAVVLLLVVRFFSFVGNAISDIFTPDPPKRSSYSVASDYGVSSDVASKPTVKPTVKPASTVAPSYSSIRPGASGEDVTKLQKRLNELGFSVGTADGSYGAKTENAVKAFQKAAGLTQDGIAGAKTQAALFALNAPTAPPSTKSASTGTNVSSVNSKSTQKSETSSSTPEKSSANYIGNRSSKKFHHSWCSSVSDMKASNRVPFDSRSEAIDYGYKPCGRCNP